MTNATGLVIWRQDYKAFGSDYGTVATGNSYKFNGKPLEANTGLYYYGARYYDPVIGRFVSCDPVMGSLENPQTLNPYSYCANNPQTYVDPNGEFWWLAAVFLFKAIAIGAGVSGAAYSLQAASTGNWSWAGFGNALGYGALTGLVTGGLALGAGALMGAVMPGISAVQGMEMVMTGANLTFAQTVTYHTSLGALGGAYSMVAGGGDWRQVALGTVGGFASGLIGYGYSYGYSKLAAHNWRVCGINVAQIAKYGVRGSYLGWLRSVGRLSNDEMFHHYFAGAAADFIGGTLGGPFKGEFSAFRTLGYAVEMDDAMQHLYQQWSGSSRSVTSDHSPCHNAFVWFANHQLWPIYQTYEAIMGE